MGLSWPKFIAECKSGLSAIARSCFLGRAYWREKFRELNQVLEELGEQAAKAEARLEELDQENGRLRERVSELEAQLAQPRPVKLPWGEAPPGQQYGAGMIALCVNLSRQIGLRPVERALRIVFEWLGVEAQLPTYQSIRLWMQRIGLDRLQTVRKTTGGVWLADHTNQIGKEKVLVVLRVRDSHLPRRGVPLRHQDVEVLALEPGEVWKRDNGRRSIRKRRSAAVFPARSSRMEPWNCANLSKPWENLVKSRW